jgi:hypothetical protein
VSEQAIPPAYLAPQPPKLDRQGLLGGLKRGSSIPGAELSNPKLVLWRGLSDGVDRHESEKPKAKLDAKHVKTRISDGAALSYVEGWHAIAEANRIFGFDAWDRWTIITACVLSGQRGHAYAAAYAARVRVSMRAGHIVIIREGSGTGEGRAPTQVKGMSSRSRAPRPTPLSGRLPRLATPSARPLQP